MKIGVLSDSHDNVHMVAKAVELFNDEGVVLVVHAGDFIAPFVVYCDARPELPRRRRLRQ